MIKQMATDISDKLKNSTLSCYFDGLVGMRAYLVKMEPLLGICSIAGSAYNKLPDSSQLSDFMEKVKAKFTRLCWFGRPWSRTISTTQDQQVLTAVGINDIYKVNIPRHEESLQIFCKYAFGQNSPIEGFEALAGEVTKLAGALPLALRVLGSYFRGMAMYEWEELLPKLRTRLDDSIESTLKFSYDTLDDEDKDLFLHIASLNHNEIKRVKETLANKFSDMNHRLHVLAEKSFISMDSEHIHMHTLLKQVAKEELAKNIFRKPQFLLSKL